VLGSFPAGHPGASRELGDMTTTRDANEKASLHPLAAALLAGGALIGGVLAANTAPAAPARVSNTYLSMNGATGFVAAGTKDGTRAVRTAQGYDAYYCYYYGYYCCDPATADGRDACCYYYGTYCDKPSAQRSSFKRDDDYAAAGFAGAGTQRSDVASINPLL
jgi:hypothetical protein